MNIKEKKIEELLKGTFSDYYAWWQKKTEDAIQKNPVRVVYKESELSINEFSELNEIHPSTLQGLFRFKGRLTTPLSELLKENNLLKKWKNFITYKRPFLIETHPYKIFQKKLNLKYLNEIVNFLSPEVSAKEKTHKVCSITSKIHSLYLPYEGDIPLLEKYWENMNKAEENKIEEEEEPNQKEVIPIPKTINKEIREREEEKEEEKNEDEYTLKKVETTILKELAYLKSDIKEKLCAVSKKIDKIPNVYKVHFKREPFLIKESITEEMVINLWDKFQNYILKKYDISYTNISDVSIKKQADSYYINCNSSYIYYKYMLAICYFLSKIIKEKTCINLSVSDNGTNFKYSITSDEVSKLTVVSQIEAELDINWNNFITFSLL